jgi:long-chain acyl-CoA synthetase
MSGYYRNQEATAAVMDDGWLNTGDIGFFDDDGYLHLSGRSKDVIVTSAGKNVYPEEVEARYRELPGVSELVVLGSRNMRSMAALSLARMETPARPR